MQYSLKTWCNPVSAAYACYNACVSCSVYMLVMNVRISDRFLVNSFADFLYSAGKKIKILSSCWRRFVTATFCFCSGQVNEVDLINQLQHVLYKTIVADLCFVFVCLFGFFKIQMINDIVCYFHFTDFVNYIFCSWLFSDRVLNRLWLLSGHLVHTFFDMHHWSKWSQYKTYGIS